MFDRKVEREMERLALSGRAKAAESAGRGLHVVCALRAATCGPL
jgi:hypothetical protein